MKTFRKIALGGSLSLSLAVILAPAVASPAIADADQTWLLLAVGERTAVVLPTEQNATTAHNGSEWYYRPGQSMGFAPAGAAISQNTADVLGLDPSDPTSIIRLSWHLGASALSPGWRAGELTGLGAQASRAIYEASTLPAYYPSGPQRDVSFDSLEGWTLCWSGTYADVIELEALWSQCDGTYLLLAGGLTPPPAVDPEPEPEPEADPELAETGSADTLLLAGGAALLLGAGVMMLRHTRRSAQA